MVPEGGRDACAEREARQDLRRNRKKPRKRAPAGPAQILS
jgi:hypothetical protein